MEEDELMEFGLFCSACNTKIDEEDPSQFHEPSGMYSCPSCGHNNVDDEGGYA